jgi:hypothetical protein
MSHVTCGTRIPGAKPPPSASTWRRCWRRWWVGARRPDGCQARVAVEFGAETWTRMELALVNLEKSDANRDTHGAERSGEGQAGRARADDENVGLTALASSTTANVLDGLVVLCV